MLEYSWVAACLLQAGWAARLWRLGLVRRYPCLTTFLVIATVSSLVGFSLYVYPELRYFTRHFFYPWFFVISQPITWALYLCVLIEVYNRAVEGYGGLQRLSQLAIHGIAVCVGLLVLGIVILDSSGNLPVSRLIGPWNRSERSIYLGLTIFCLALGAFVAYFRLSVPKNVRVVFAVFGLVFAGQVGLDALHAQRGLSFNEVRNSITFFFFIPFWLAGLLAFSKAGETIPATAITRWQLDERQEAMLTARLRSFNETLLRVLRS